MNSNDTLSKIKLFSLANSLTENELDKIESEFDIDLGRNEKKEIQYKSFYLQFSSDYRKEARTMAKHYEVFYCLEKSIRSLVVELMEEKYGGDWWNNVKEDIRKNVDINIKRGRIRFYNSI